MPRHLTNLQPLIMCQCRPATITGDTFRYFANLQYLDMSRCNQSRITEDAFRHLTNLQYLFRIRVRGMSWCNQRGYLSTSEEFAGSEYVWV